MKTLNIRVIVKGEALYFYAVDLAGIQVKTAITRGRRLAKFAEEKLFVTPEERQIYGLVTFGDDGEPDDAILTNETGAYRLIVNVKGQLGEDLRKYLFGLIKHAMRSVGGPFGGCIQA